MKPISQFILLILFSVNLYYSQSLEKWANLSKYKVHNQKLVDKENLIVLMGDSITEGWSIHDSSFFKDNPKLINRGISGQTSSQMLSRFRQDVINLKPKTVVINSGTNDIAENTGPISLEDILGNIISMCELANANNIEVILTSVLPAKHFPWRKDLDPANKIVSLNKMIMKYAAKENYDFVDYHLYMSDDGLGLFENLSYDGVHPNYNGYKVMEKLLLEYLETK